MSKAAFHQDLIGRRIFEDPRKAEYIEAAKFNYYGLTASSFVTIVGAWIQEGSVKVLVQDADGHTAEFFITGFLLQEPE